TGAAASRTATPGPHATEEPATEERWRRQAHLLGLLHLLMAIIRPRGTLFRTGHLQHLPAHGIAVGFALLLLLLLGRIGLCCGLSLVISISITIAPTGRAETGRTVPVRFPFLAALIRVEDLFFETSFPFLFRQGVELLDLLHRLLFPFLCFRLALLEWDLSVL